MWRPLIAALCASVLLFGVSLLLKESPAFLQLLVLIASMGLSVLGLLRYGMSAADATALGGLARFARKGLGHK